MTSGIIKIEVDEILNSPFPRRSIRTHDDWHSYVMTPAAVRPALPSASEYEAMKKTEKKLINARRVHYNNSFGPVLTPPMMDIHEAGIRLAAQNLRAQPGARPGLIIDGDSTIGKSTIVMQLGRKYELKVTKQHSITTTPTGHRFIPVAYINLPATMAIMNFNHLLARFYNIPLSRGAREEEITDAIKEAAADCCTSMFILDDIHFLEIKNRTHKTLNNHIKSLANSISATFVYAGIDLGKTGLLTEGKSTKEINNTQTGHRFKKFDLSAFSTATEIERNNFKNLLNYFEEQLMLYKQKPGDLFENFGTYILDRTGGFIGPLTHLLRECAQLAISSGVEEFTLRNFRKIRLDYDSEKRYQLILKRNGTKLKQGAVNE